MMVPTCNFLKKYILSFFSLTVKIKFISTKKEIKELSINSESINNKILFFILKKKNSYCFYLF